MRVIEELGQLSSARHPTRAASRQTAWRQKMCNQPLGIFDRFHVDSLKCRSSAGLGNGTVRRLTAGSGVTPVWADVFGTVPLSPSGCESSFSHSEPLAVIERALPAVWSLLSAAGRILGASPRTLASHERSLRAAQRVLATAQRTLAASPSVIGFKLKILQKAYCKLPGVLIK